MARFYNFATQLFAAARGIEFREGTYRCFYCTAPCNENYSSKEYVKKSFTSRDLVGGGDYVCAGCVAALQEKATITLPDGTVRENQKVRGYSWVIANGHATAATKSHREWLLGCYLNPPDPPFVICLSDSGQKHLLYRSRLCLSREVITSSLEGEAISCGVDEFRKRIVTCKRVAAALGKPSLSSSLSFSALARLSEYHGDYSIADDWIRCREEPLTRLCSWLTPAKKECESEYPPADAGPVDA